MNYLRRSDGHADVHVIPVHNLFGCVIDHYTRRHKRSTQTEYDSLDESMSNVMFNVGQTAEALEGSRRVAEHVL